MNMARVRLTVRAMWRHGWRWTRRLFVVFLILLVAFSAFLHVRTALLTRKIQAVVAGLAQLRIDASPEAEVRRLIPSMALLDPWQAPTDRGEVRFYHVRISNAFEELDFPGYGRFWWPIGGDTVVGGRPPASKWRAFDATLWVAYALGWRHIAFNAYVNVKNGVVSAIGYTLEPDVDVSSAQPTMAIVASVREFRGYMVPVRVTDIDDESPEFRLGPETGYRADEYGVESLGLAYTTEAPRELVSHAFDLDLSCFWGLLGCDSARQVLPRLWLDREAVVRAAASRLRSSNPCPDRILAGRTRLLPDLVVELREVTDPALAGATSPVAQRATSRPGYQLKETILGDANSAPWVVDDRTPQNYPQGLLWRPDPAAPSMKAGDEVLVFLGVDFQSCRVVPATESAIAAIRSATPAARRTEDQSKPRQ